MAQQPAQTEEIYCYKCKGGNPPNATQCIWCGTSLNPAHREYTPPPAMQAQAAPAPTAVYTYAAPVDEVAGLATAAMVLGIVGMVLSVFLSYCTLPITVTGLILGAISLKSTTRRSQALTGVITSLLGIAVAILWAIWIASILANLGTTR